MPPPDAADDTLRTLVAVPLRIGTVAAVAMVAVGLAMSVVGGSAQSPEPTPLIETIGAGGGTAVISAGLLLLTFVPLAVAIGTVIAFWRSRERRYLIGSVVVAIVLVASPLLSLALLAPST